MREAHAENRVARIEQREIHRLIGLRTGMRLHVGVGGAEELLQPLEGEALSHVHVFAATVVALAWGSPRRTCS